VVFPISNGGVGLISLKVIAPIAYLMSWILVALVIASKFLLEAIYANSLGPFPFQAHLKLV